MTGLELEAKGLFFRVEKGGGLRAEGPAPVLKRLDFEVSMRIELVGDGQTYATTKRTPWGCDVCGDQIGHARGGSCPLCGLRTEDGKSRCSFVYGGTCGLCVLARQRALAARRAREAARS